MHPENKKISKRDDRVKELQPLIRRVIFSRYLISKITIHRPGRANLRSQNSNECIKIKGKVHVHIMCEHMMIIL